MDERHGFATALGLLAIGVAASVAVYAQLPDQMATHWNAAGEPNGYMEKQFGAFLAPAVALGLLGVFALVPRIDPLGENVEAFREQYNRFVVVMTGFLVVVHLVVLAPNLGYDLPVTLTVAPAIGGLFYFVGVLLEHAERNWFVGVRTPWTLSSDEVWDRTHALAAPLFKLSGVVAALGVFAGEYAVYLLVGPAVVTALVATGYSFYVYRRLDAEPDVVGGD